MTTPPSAAMEPAKVGFMEPPPSDLLLTPTPVAPVAPTAPPIEAPVSNGNGLPLPPGMSMPGAPVQEVKAEMTIQQEAVPAPGMPSVPPPMTPPPTSLPNNSGVNMQEMPMAKTTTINTGEPDGISDVQKAALHSILSIKGAEYEALATEAFKANDIVKNPVPSIDELSYKEAVTVVKYGNDKFRRR